MTVQELKVFLKQIKLKMKGTHTYKCMYMYTQYYVYMYTAISKELTTYLIVKVELVVENKLLHQNIAHLAR